MNFDLTVTERMILDLTRDFAEREVAPRAAEIDRTAEFPADLVAKMGQLGLMGIPFPPEYGGAGQSYLLFARVVEELCRACASTGLILDVTTSLCGEPIAKFGSHDVKTRYLTPLAQGQTLGALAMTEPEAGKIGRASCRERV